MPSETTVQRQRGPPPKPKMKGGPPPKKKLPGAGSTIRNCL